jgi:hypothetical protein
MTKKTNRKEKMIVAWVFVSSRCIIDEMAPAISLMSQRVDVAIDEGLDGYPGVNMLL